MDPFFANEEKLIRVLYKNVTNAEDVKKFVLTAGLPLCLLRPKLIVDEFQLSVAITKALYNKRDNTMTTKTFPAELIYCLSPTRNINESLKLFGLHDSDTEILIVGEAGIFESIRETIHGEEMEISEICRLTDYDAVKEIYQISAEELTGSSLLDSVVSRMSTKDYIL